MIGAGGWKKHEMGHQLQALVTVIYKWLKVCIFRADVPVSRSVTVSNELHSPLHFIYWTDPLFIPISSFIVVKLVIQPVKNTSLTIMATVLLEWRQFKKR